MNSLVEIMIRAALAGGREVMRVYAGEIAVELKDDRSPLTEADRRSHDAIVGILTAAAPDIPLLSEEGAHTAHGTRAGWTRYFLIDPLDGTKEFIKRNGEFTVNVALVERVAEGGAYPRGASPSEGAAARWAPVAGVVYAPDLGELFVGDRAGARMWSGLAAPEEARLEEAGGGVSPRGAAAPALPAEGDALRLPRSHRSDRRPYTVIASRSHMSPETEAFVAARRAEYPDLTLLSAGSSLKLCRVAEGAADEYPRFAPTMEWDTAAGDAVARAAGCTVLEWDHETGAPSGPLRYNKEDLHNPWFLVSRRIDSI